MLPCDLRRPEGGRYLWGVERLRLWDADGQQVLDGIQCVAVFG
jgi:hypothetical protein